jgi:hypothetical protein
MVYAKQKARRCGKSWSSERVSICTNAECRIQVTKRLGRHAVTGGMIQMDPISKRLDVPVWKTRRQLIELETRHGGANGKGR